MTFIEALKLLGLKKDYTETDLKKAYHREILNCHPDLHTDKTKEEQEIILEKAKKINQAKEILENNLKRGSNNFHKMSEEEQDIFDKEVEYTELKLKYIFEVNKDLLCITLIDSEYSRILHLKKELLENIDKFTKLLSVNPPISILKEKYEEYCNTLIILLQAYIYELYLRNDIPELEYKNINKYKIKTFSELRRIIIDIINKYLNEETITNKFLDIKAIIPKISTPIKEKYQELIICGNISIHRAKDKYLKELEDSLNKYKKREEILNEVIKESPNKIEFINLLRSTIYDEDKFYEIYYKFNKPKTIKGKTKKLINKIKNIF